MLFQNIAGINWLVWIGVVAALMLLNEAARANKWVALLLFVGLPVILTIFVWPTTAGPDSSTGTWFHWVKVYSALAGCLGFMALRFSPKFQHNKWALIFPPAILAFNIMEAVIRDFQVKKGSWLQARAQTLAFWMMFTMSYPTFVTDSQFSVQSTHSSAALMTVSALALAINVAVLVLHVYRIIKHRRNVLTDDIYAGTVAHDQVLADNTPADQQPAGLNLKK